jgi:hypothetical protein
VKQEYVDLKSSLKKNLMLQNLQLKKNLCSRIFIEEESFASESSVEN